jgi:hypothetical protein
MVHTVANHVNSVLAIVSALAAANTCRITPCGISVFADVVVVVVGGTRVDTVLRARPRTGADPTLRALAVDGFGSGS